MTEPAAASRSRAEPVGRARVSFGEGGPGRGDSSAALGAGSAASPVRRPPAAGEQADGPLQEPPGCSGNIARCGFAATLGALALLAACVVGLPMLLGRLDVTSEARRFGVFPQTSATITHDCLGTVEKWPEAKRVWCCQNSLVGCHKSELPQRSQRAFDCEAGPQNLPDDWTHKQKAWCCEHQGITCESHGANQTSTAGPPQETELQATQPNTPQPFTTQPPDLYDCQDGLWNWMGHWKAAKRQWCCTHKLQFCPTPPAPPHNCSHGLETWQTGWTTSKKQWCCQKSNRGCGPCDYKCVWNATSASCRQHIKQVDRFDDTSACRDFHTKVVSACPLCSYCSPEDVCPVKLATGTVANLNGGLPQEAGGEATGSVANFNGGLPQYAGGEATGTVENLNTGLPPEVSGEASAGAPPPPLGAPRAGRRPPTPPGQATISEMSATGLEEGHPGTGEPQARMTQTMTVVGLTFEEADRKMHRLIGGIAQTLAVEEDSVSVTSMQDTDISLESRRLGAPPPALPARPRRLPGPGFAKDHHSGQPPRVMEVSYEVSTAADAADIVLVKMSRVAHDPSSMKRHIEKAMGLKHLRIKASPPEEHTPTTTSVAAELGYGCDEGREMWKVLWSLAKQRWCCAHQQVACSQSIAPTTAAPPLTSSSELYNCNNWETGNWSAKRMEWCCAYFHWGCAEPDRFNCSAGFATRSISWSAVKKVWCCKHHKAGCRGGPAPGVPQAGAGLAELAVQKTESHRAPAVARGSALGLATVLAASGMVVAVVAALAATSRLRPTGEDPRSCRLFVRCPHDDVEVFDGCAGHRVTKLEVIHHSYAVVPPRECSGMPVKEEAHLQPASLPP